MPYHYQHEVYEERPASTHSRRSRGESESRRSGRGQGRTRRDELSTRNLRRLENTRSNHGSSRGHNQGSSTRGATQRSSQASENERSRRQNGSTRSSQQQPTGRELVRYSGGQGGRTSSSLGGVLMNTIRETFRSSRSSHSSSVVSGNERASRRHGNGYYVLGPLGGPPPHPNAIFVGFVYPGMMICCEEESDSDSDDSSDSDSDSDDESDSDDDCDCCCHCRCGCH